jgi:3-isopropylmalate dehydrogenase
VGDSYELACIPGDGIGPEVVAEARKAVGAAAARFGFTVDWVDLDLGADRWLRTGEALPDTALKELGEVDAILLGAVGRPDVPPGVLERGLLLRLRFELDLYVNLRPVKLYPGVASPLAGVGPDDLDLLVVRENTEGVYAGAGGTVHRGTPMEVATETSIETRAGVERCLRYAAARARERAGRLTLVHKTNVLTHAGDLWQRAAREVAGEAGVALDYAHADAACLYLVSDPGRFDVVVTDNLFGDILTDLGAAVAGGLGTAASANLNPAGGSGGLKERSAGGVRGTPEGSPGESNARGGSPPVKSPPSLFEPVHGSAPDIAGTGKANPVAAVLSAALLLQHLGQQEAAAAVESAAVAALPEAGQYSTRALGDRIAGNVAGGEPPAT